MGIELEREMYLFIVRIARMRSLLLRYSRRKGDACAERKRSQQLSLRTGAARSLVSFVTLRTYEDRGIQTHRTPLDLRASIAASRRSQYGRHPRTMEELERVITEEWSATDLNFIARICRNMPRRLQAVIANNGHKIPY